MHTWALQPIYLPTTSHCLQWLAHTAGKAALQSSLNWHGRQKSPLVIIGVSWGVTPCSWAAPKEESSTVSGTCLGGHPLIQACHLLLCKGAVVILKIGINESNEPLLIQICTQQRLCSTSEHGSSVSPRSYFWWCKYILPSYFFKRKYNTIWLSMSNCEINCFLYLKIPFLSNYSNQKYKEDHIVPREAWRDLAVTTKPRQT